MPRVDAARVVAGAVATSALFVSVINVNTALEEPLILTIWVVESEEVVGVTVTVERMVTVAVAWVIVTVVVAAGVTPRVGSRLEVSREVAVVEGEAKTGNVGEDVRRVSTLVKVWLEVVAMTAGVVTKGSSVDAVVVGMTLSLAGLEVAIAGTVEAVVDTAAAADEKKLY